MFVENVRDVDLGRLRQHLLDHGTGNPPPSAAETLQHFRIEPGSEPPDAA